MISYAATELALGDDTGIRAALGSNVSGTLLAFAASLSDHPRAATW
jgi:hypothetical protein